MKTMKKINTLNSDNKRNEDSENENDEDTDNGENISSESTRSEAILINYLEYRSVLRIEYAHNSQKQL